MTPGIIHSCAFCATKLAYDAPRCVRCHTRYCDATCQHAHWADGHKKKCKKIARGGGAEQYYADKKAKEAAEAAVVACAAQGVPQNAECFICRSSIEGQGIVSGCACHGGMGLAHVACLVRQAEIEQKRWDEEHTGEGHNKWEKCFDCGQRFHGAVAHALGWACWKTYLGRPETSRLRLIGLAVLGGSFVLIGRSAEALPVLEANLALARRYWSKADILIAQTNLSGCLDLVGRHAEALVLTREIYAGFLATYGISDERTITSGLTLAGTLWYQKHREEARLLVRDTLLPAARRSLGSDDDITLKLDQLSANILRLTDRPTRDDLLEAETIMQDIVRRRRRVFGPAHPDTRYSEKTLSEVRAKLAQA